MGRTPDRFPGPLMDEELQLDTEMHSGDPTVLGAIRYVTGVGFKALDGTGVFDLRSGSGLTADQHRILRQLIHFIDEGPAEGFTTGAYKEITNPGVFPTAATWYESSSKAKKIVELTVTWTGPVPTTKEWEVYDTDGVTVIGRVTDTITYSAIFESSRDRVIEILP